MIQFTAQLTITGGAYKTSTTGSNVIVSVAGGEKITLVGAKGKSVNIQLSSYSEISSLILFDDDNFVTDTANIDSVAEISDTNYSVGNVSTVTSYDIFTQNKFLVTTSYDKK